ncbi:hypothetical protein [Streptomyces sp. NPDC058665]|uniref:hypothetical protein n=1 Tax=Streptomyces sp. NPDC058665 TaxID=3346586 RepID=UPI003666BA20
MTRPTRALQAAYATGALLVGVTALRYAAAGHWPHALAAAALATLLCEGAVREAEYAHTRRQLREAIEEQTRRDTRLAHSTALKGQFETTWHALLATCCLRAWETQHRDHDPATCTRKETP